MVAIARQQNGLSARARVRKAVGVIPVGLPRLTVIDARRTALENPSSLKRRVERMVAAYRECFLQDLHFDDRVARELLDRLGLPRPTLFAKEAHRMIGQARMSQVPLCSTRG